MGVFQRVCDFHRVSRWRKRGEVVVKSVVNVVAHRSFFVAAKYSTFLNFIFAGSARSV
jgi:hypothetical protein